MQKDYSVKAIRESFKEKGIFYTPPELALYLKSLVDITGYKEVYDPTCGRGNLLSVFEIEKSDVFNYPKFFRYDRKITYHEARRYFSEIFGKRRRNQKYFSKV